MVEYMLWMQRVPGSDITGGIEGSTDLGTTPRGSVNLHPQGQTRGEKETFCGLEAILTLIRHPKALERNFCFLLKTRSPVVC